MARYYTANNSAWGTVDVRGTPMAKLEVWKDGYDIQTSMFRMTQGMVINQHTHQHWVLVVVLTGEMEITSDADGIVRVPEGGCYVITPGDRHQERAVRETTVVVTQLDYHPAYPDAGGMQDASNKIGPL